MAARLNLKIEKGLPFERVLTLRDAKRRRPIDLTGMQALMQIRPEPGSPVMLLELASYNGRILLGGTSGVLTLRLDGAETASLAFTEAAHDLLLIDSLGKRRKLIKGQVFVEIGVTE